MDQINQNELLAQIADMMGEFVDNWPKPKRVDTALKLIAKTLRAALDDAETAATAALAALRETHHLVPKDQEPVGWLYQWQDNEPVYMPQKRDWADYPNNAGWTETPLYVLEKRHD